MLTDRLEEIAQLKKSIEEQKESIKVMEATSEGAEAAPVDLTTAGSQVRKVCGTPELHPNGRRVS